MAKMNSYHWNSEVQTRFSLLSITTAEVSENKEGEFAGVKGHVRVVGGFRFTLYVSVFHCPLAANV